MANPCSECIVDAMCKAPCENLEDFLHNLISSRCNLHMDYEGKLGYSIRYCRTGSMILQDRNDYSVHIRYVGGKICDITTYPPIYSKKNGKRMSLYNPLKGATLYAIKPM